MKIKIIALVFFLLFIGQFAFARPPITTEIPLFQIEASGKRITCNARDIKMEFPPGSTMYLVLTDNSKQGEKHKIGKFLVLPNYIVELYKRDYREDPAEKWYKVGDVTASTSVRTQEITSKWFIFDMEQEHDGVYFHRISCNGNKGMMDFVQHFLNWRAGKLANPSVENVVKEATEAPLKITFPKFQESNIIKILGKVSRTSEDYNQELQIQEIIKDQQKSKLEREDSLDSLKVPFYSYTFEIPFGTYTVSYPLSSVDIEITPPSHDISVTAKQTYQLDFSYKIKGVVGPQPPPPGAKTGNVYYRFNDEAINILRAKEIDTSYASILNAMKVNDGAVTITVEKVGDKDVIKFHNVSTGVIYTVTFSFPGYTAITQWWEFEESDISAN